MSADANSIAREQGLDALRDILDHAEVIPLKPAPAGNATAETSPPPEVQIVVLPPLTLDEWRGRDLPAPDLIMGHWLSTTSRVLLTAATGLGKTNYGIALGIRCAAAHDFLHWRAHRKARVLYIDGEMSRRLLKQRVLDEETRQRNYSVPDQRNRETSLLRGGEMVSPSRAYFIPRFRLGRATPLGASLADRSLPPPERPDTMTAERFCSR
jgi:hypothetical protein